MDYGLGKFLRVKEVGSVLSLGVIVEGSFLLYYIGKVIGGYRLIFRKGEIMVERIDFLIYI